MVKFAKNQHVMVNIDGTYYEGFIKTLLKNGKIKILLEDDDEEVVALPSAVVDYDVYMKKHNKNKKESPKLNKTKEVENDDDDELEWGDIDEEDESDDESDDDSDDEENEIDLDDLDDLDDELDHDLNDDDESNDEEESEEEIEEEKEEEEDESEEELYFENPKKSSKDDSDNIGDDWFEIGDEDDEKFMSLPSTTKRFWLEREKSTYLTIITEKPITYREHRVRISRKIYNLTCLATSGKRCPLCEIGKSASPKKAFYVIDHTSYYSKAKNKQINHSLAIWVLGTRQYSLLKASAEKYFKGEKNFTYRGLKIEVRRSNDRLAPNSGDVFFIEGVVKKDIFKNDYDKSIKDLVQELKPLDEKTLRSKLPLIDDEEEYYD